jgi:hypothetical protein
LPFSHVIKKGKDIKMKNKVEKESTTFRMRKNPWMVATIVLTILALLLIAGNILESRQEVRSENEILCSVIYATPAWAMNGMILEYGVIIPENTSIDLVGTELIPNNIKLLYQDGCSACEAQINYFKEQGTWDAYVNSGLTINCGEFK